MANYVDQATEGVKKVQQYINFGLEAVPEFSMEFLELGTEDASLTLNEHKALMKRYIAMDADLNSYLKAVEQVKTLVADCSVEADDVEAKLQEIYQKEKSNAPPVTSSKAYQDMQCKLSNTDGGAATQTDEDDEDAEVAFHGQTQTFKCPYTGKEMVDPVKNTNCGHSYERDAIMTYIKQRGKRARCPFSGCMNQGVMTQRCLVPDTKLKKEIANRKKRSQK